MKEEYRKGALFFSYFFGTIVFHFRSPEAKEQTPKKTKEKKKKHRNKKRYNLVKRTIHSHRWVAERLQFLNEP